MEIKWLNPDAKFDRLVLAGDIGGTNTNLGLVGYKDGKFTLILETVCPSQCIEGLDTPICETLKAAIENRADLKPSHLHQRRRSGGKQQVRHDEPPVVRRRRCHHECNRHPDSRD